MQDILVGIAAKYNLGDVKIFFTPNIPEKKLFNAISTYASGLPPAEVVFLMDDTLWGGAKEGMLLSRDKLFCHELLTDPVSILLADIKTIYAQKSDIYINNRKFISCTMLDKKHAEDFCSFLLELVCALRGERGTAAVQAAPVEQAESPTTAPERDAAPQEKGPEDSKTASPPQVDEEVQAILRKYSFGDEKVFSFPRIPEQKLSNAINAYATRVPCEDVLVLLDDTMMGGAKEGMILTRDHVFFHEFLTDPVTVKLADIESVFAKDGSLFINKQRVFKATHLAKGYLLVLGNMINDIAELNLTEEERAEKQLVKHLGSRREYYFHWLMTTLPKRSKLDSMSNSIDVFVDQFFAVTVQQENDAWARNAKMENETREAFDAAAYALLKLAFTFSKRISDKLNKNKVCTYMAMSDCIIHEILIGLLYRGMYLIDEAFSNHSDRRGFIGLYSEDLIVEHILAPFYQFKISNDNALSSLNKTALQSDIKQFALGVLEGRRTLQRICDDTDKISTVVSLNIKSHISKNNINSDSKSIITLEECMDENRNDDPELTQYCYLLSACVSDEIRSYMEEADEKLAAIIQDFFG
ncbi:MAG: hypothetical protein DELT_01689 [Desulfovibrio sp.]